MSTLPTPAAPVASPGGERVLGRTGARVEAVSLGGEGALRTTDRQPEAVAVILEALRLGVRYFDTAPAYQPSQDYYGAAFRAAGAGARDRVFLASKTHCRDRDGALRLLDDSLRRLGTDHLDLWQLHDLREVSELDEIFGKTGAIAAVEAARKDGRVRHVGITGHHHPAILLEAMRRYEGLDTLLVAFNPADPARLPFAPVIAEARRRGMGIIGMKVMAAGQLLEDAAATPQECIGYAASVCDTVIIGCKTPREVAENVAIGRALGSPMTRATAAALEARLARRHARYDSFKSGR